MQLRKFRYLLCSGLLALAANTTAHAQTELANPSFEEDVANVGNPDGWSIPKAAKVKVVGGSASDGNRALLVEGGYIAVSQELQVPTLARQRILLSMDAKAVSENAVIGARIGYYSTDNKWRDAPMIWNKPITGQYATYSAERKLPDDAKGGRFYIGLYRSDNKSTFYLDNIKLRITGGLADTDARRAVALARDAGYALDRLNTTTATLPEKAQWQKQLTDIVAEANQAADTLAARFPEYEQKVREINTGLFQTLAKKQNLVTNWAPAFERLEPNALPSQPNSAPLNLAALRGEHRAFGIDLATGKDQPSTFVVRIKGAPAGATVTWRRHIFTENWYSKGKILITDPLTQLPANGSIEVQPGENVRLYADMSVAIETRPGSYPVTIELVEGNTVRDTRTLNLQVLTKAVPPRHTQHYQFLYTTSPIVNNHTADSVRDLESRGVTDVEWAFMPPTVFDNDGNIKKINFGFYDRMLKAFGPSFIRLNVFWQPAYKSFTTEDGTKLEVLSPAWKNAFTQVFQAWLDHAAKQGVGNDRITILVADEIHSKALENSPDAGIQQYVEIARFFKEKFPRIKNYLTLSFYGFPKDVEAALPYVDVIMPHLSQPDKLTRNAPPTYNPQKAFTEEIYPMLREARDKRGLEIWSYHVAAGRSDDIKAPWSRGYSLLAAVTGHVGMGYWSYNVSRGSTWDDTDGGILDYNFVYDGLEKHPLAQKYNVTGERVVPSLRWEAVRASMQDADLYLELAKQPPTPKIKAAMEAAQKIAAYGGRLNANTTPALLEEISQQLREAYESAK